MPTATGSEAVNVFIALAAREANAGIAIHARAETASGARRLRSAGALFLGAGLLGLAAWGLFCLENSQASWVPKLLVPLAIAGALLLLGAAVRARARTLRYDPYRDIRR